MTASTPSGNDSPSAHIEAAGLNANIFSPESLQWIGDHSVELIIAVISSMLIFSLLSLIRHHIQRLSREQDKKQGIASIALRVFSRTSMVFILTLSLKIVAGISGAPEQLTAPINFIFFITLVFQSAIWLREGVLGLIDRKISTSDEQHSDLKNARDLIRMLVTIGLAAIAVIIILDNIGVNVTALIAGLGVGGIAIGLAAQGIISDLFAALSIIFDKPFQVGDSIMFDDFDGSVEATGLMTTRLRSIYGEQVIISNANLLQKKISNMTRVNERRIRFSVGVIYQTTPEQLDAIPKIFDAIIKEYGFSFRRCGFVGFGDSALNYRMEFEILSPSWDVIFDGRNAVGLALVKRFAEEGIEFAYPTQMNFTAGPDGSAI